MRLSIFVLAFSLLAAACPVEHSGTDTTPFKYDGGRVADANAVDGEVIDTTNTDTTNTDTASTDLAPGNDVTPADAVTAPDATTADSVTFDTLVQVDAVGFDGLIVDGQAVDTQMVDATIADATSVDTAVVADGAVPDHRQADGAAGNDGHIIPLDATAIDSSPTTDATPRPDTWVGPDTNSTIDDAWVADTRLDDAAAVDVVYPDVPETDTNSPADEAGGLTDPLDISLPLDDFVFNIIPADEEDCFRMNFSDAVVVTAESSDGGGGCGFDSQFYLYADGETDPSNYLLFDDDDGASTCSLLQFYAAAGSSYILCIDEFNNDNEINNGHLSIQTSPASEDEAGGLTQPEAMTLPISGVSLSLLGGDDEDCFVFTMDHSAAVVADALASRCHSETEIRLYQAGETNPDNQLEVHPTGTSCYASDFSVDPGSYVVCFSLNSTLPDLFTNFMISIEEYPVPENNTCTMAESITMLQNSTVTVNGTTNGARDNRTSTTPDCQYSGDYTKDVFYTFTTPADITGHAIVRLNTDGWSGVAYTFAGDCSSSTVDLNCDDLQSYFSLAPATTYYVVVDGRGSGEGDFELELTHIADQLNTTCDTAATVTIPADGSPVVVDGITMGNQDNRDSTDTNRSCQELDTRHAPELFFLLDTALATTNTVQVSLQTIDWKSSLYLFDHACSASEQMDLYCQGEYYFPDPIWYRFELEPAKPYTLVVDGYGHIDDTYDAHRGIFELTVKYYIPQPVPSGPETGDTCADAIPILTSSGGFSGSTAADHGTNTITRPRNLGCDDVNYAEGKDVFYKFTLQPNEQIVARVEHGNSSREVYFYILEDRNCGDWSTSACVASTSFEQDQSGELAHTNSNDTAVDYFLVVDAQYNYRGEQFDLFWEISQ